MKEGGNLTKIQDVTHVLAELQDNELAQKWLHNDMIKMNLAASYDFWLEDTDIPMTLKEHIEQYLVNAPYLGGVFSMDSPIDNPGC